MQQIQVDLQKPHPSGTKATLQIFVGVEGDGGGGGVSQPFVVTFQRSRASTVLAIVMATMGALSAILLLMITSHGGAEGRVDRGRAGGRWREGARYNVRGSGPDESVALLSGRLDEEHFSIQRQDVVLAHKIARGAFGNVYKATWLGAECAVKQIDVWSLQDLTEFLDEAHLLSQLHHPNIVQLLGICDSSSPQGGQEMLLVMEYMARGSLSDVLGDASISLPPKQKASMALEAARGMLYLHTLKPPVLHRDLKSPNLLVDANFRIKIADFGLSRFRVEYTMTFCGSPKWTAPEVLNGLSYDTAADVWSYGVVLWELLTREVPYAAGTWLPAMMPKHSLSPIKGRAGLGPRRGGLGGLQSPPRPSREGAGCNGGASGADSGVTSQWANSAATGGFTSSSLSAGSVIGGGHSRSGSKGGGGGLCDAAVELLGSQVQSTPAPLPLYPCKHARTHVYMQYAWIC